MWSESQIELRSFQVFNYRRDGLLCLVAHITLFHLDLRKGERGFNTSLNCNHPKLGTYVPSTENIGSTFRVKREGKLFTALRESEGKELITGSVTSTE